MAKQQSKAKEVKKEEGRPSVEVVGDPKKPAPKPAPKSKPAPKPKAEQVTAIGVYNLKVTGPVPMKGIPLPNNRVMLLVGSVSQVVEGLKIMNLQGVNTVEQA